MIECYTVECPLCRLANDRDLLTILHIENNMIIVVDCLECRVPMAVLKAHRSSFSDVEKDHIRAVFHRLSTDGGIIDWEQRKIPDHAHCHLRPHPFPGTQHWEKL